MSSQSTHGAYAARICLIVNELRTRSWSPLFGLRQLKSRIVEICALLCILQLRSSPPRAHRASWVVVPRARAFCRELIGVRSL